MKSNDYILVKAPEKYPGKTYSRGYCYEHRLKWWQEKGELPEDDEVIHHINGDESDNRISNLEKMSASEHSTHHSNTGRTKVNLNCPECGKEFQKEKRQTHLVKGGDKTFCSRQCSGKYNQRKREYA